MSNASNRKFSVKSRNLTSQINGINAKISNLSAKNGIVNNSELGAATKSVDNLRNAITSTNANFNKNYQSLAQSAGLKKNTPKVSISQMNNELNKLQKEINAIKAAANREKIAKQKAALAGLKGQLKTIRAKVVGTSSNKN